MDILKDFYKNKKVLITGHTGFKGSWLTIWLKQLRATVIGIALDPMTERDLFYLADLEKKITDYRKDIRDLEEVKKIFKQEQPEIVFHLAAQALVIPGYDNPVDTFSTNIMGTANILEACRLTPSVKQVIIVTTDKVYVNKETQTGYAEQDPLGGYDPYSASKAAAEIVAQSYRLSYNQSPSHQITQSISTARAGNVIGGGDWSKYRLVPDCIRSLEAGENIVIRNPESVRPWQHVLEPLSGYLLLGVKQAEDEYKYSGAWNFGPSDNDLARVMDLADMIINFWGSGKWETDEKIVKFHETGLLTLNTNKAKDILGWKPVLSFRESVQWTIEWYKLYKKINVNQLCSDQIGRYTNKWNSENLV